MQTTDQYQSLRLAPKSPPRLDFGGKKSAKTYSPSRRASNERPNQAAIPFLSAVKARASSAMFLLRQGERENQKPATRGIGEEDDRNRGPRGNRIAFRTVPVSLLVFEIVGGWMGGCFSSSRCDAHGGEVG